MPIDCLLEQITNVNVSDIAILGRYVGADQLIGGVWPDNEPGVSCLDWKSGQPNAKCVSQASVCIRR